MQQEIIAIWKECYRHALQVYSLCRSMRMLLPTVPRRLCHFRLARGAGLKVAVESRNYIIYCVHTGVVALRIDDEREIDSRVERFVRSLEAAESEAGVAWNWQALLVWSTQWLEWMRSRHEGLVKHKKHQQRQFRGSRRERALQRALGEAGYLMQLDCF